MAAIGKRFPTRYLVPLLDQLRRQNFDVDQLLRLVGLDATAFEARDATLNPAQFETFVVSAQRLTGRTDLGFETGRLIQQTMHELLGYGMLGCRSVDQVLRLVVRHHHLMTETFQFLYRRVGAGTGEVNYTPAIGMSLEALHFHLELLAMGFHNQVRLFLGSEVPAYDLYLSMPEPAHIKRYDAFAPARFHFVPGALPGLRVTMGADLLDRPLPLANPRLVEDVDQRLAAIGQRHPAGDEGWGDFVKMMLRQAHGELTTLDDLARHVGVSARTIDRHLRKEGLQFREVSQHARFERACELLVAPAATVAQVAADLGFSDAANFSRAFRRVVGTTPGEYQKRSLTADQA